ncbi:hypothetical protein [Xanthomarina sp. GH4-25]|uniref:hypothetical protein n=1 Tax=Xanthomarina sp. GH4-25 TaxID=3349335 RepID=UPI000D6765F4|nr:hypothetical protein DI383_07685 [Flavobacteriaceae bacterium LYZ1037]
MKKTVEHLRYVRTDSEICSFYICNLFKIDADKIELNDIFELDLLHEKYFLEKREQNRTSKIQNWNLKYPKNKTKVINSYGPILKPTITANDFEKHNFKEYITKIELIIDSWRKAGDDYEAYDLEIFHNKFLTEFHDFNLNKRVYYFLDSDLIEQNKKHEFEWIYSWFFTIIGIDTESNTILILNYGND